MITFVEIDALKVKIHIWVKDYGNEYKMNVSAGSSGTGHDVGSPSRSLFNERIIEHDCICLTRIWGSQANCCEFKLRCDLWIDHVPGCQAKKFAPIHTFSPSIHTFSPCHRLIHRKVRPDSQFSVINSHFLSHFLAGQTLIGANFSQTQAPFARAAQCCCFPLSGTYYWT